MFKLVTTARLPLSSSYLENKQQQTPFEMKMHQSAVDVHRYIMMKTTVRFRPFISAPHVFLVELEGGTEPIRDNEEG